LNLLATPDNISSLTKQFLNLKYIAYSLNIRTVILIEIAHFICTTVQKDSLLNDGLTSSVIYNTLPPLLSASVPAGGGGGEIDSSAVMQPDWQTVGMSPSHVSHENADSVTCQLQSQLTVAALDYQLDLITRSASALSSLSSFNKY